MATATLKVSLTTTSGRRRSQAPRAVLVTSPQSYSPLVCLPVVSRFNSLCPSRKKLPQPPEIHKSEPLGRIAYFPLEVGSPVKPPQDVFSKC
jgi:hypothetical protein